MDAEGGVQPRRKKSSWGWQKGTLLLAYQSFGVVYGDLCISPVYVYKNTFSGKLRLHEEDEEILGVLSLVFWSLTLIPLLKYIILVLGADDNGEGGTFALYSLMCRRSRMGLLNSLHAGHGSLSTYNQDEPCKESRSSLIIRGFFERHYSLRVVLLLFVLMGTSMVIGDGVLTPTMSVLSAVSGLRIRFPELHENYTVLVACIVLVGLFGLQHYGTHRVGFLFAPILISWLACIGGIGIYNIFKWNPSVVRALSPYYIYNFFRKAGKDGWSSLGGIVLCITGAEAMFADLGHFSKLSLRLGFTIVVYPCLVLAYMGEAAYLSKHREDLQSSFYKALPDRVFWPVLIIATLATAVGSQAIISATFSIISQCRALGCFPRIKVVHTSSHVHGQIYIPEVNWTLMFLCLAVTIGFRDTEMIGNAYGLAVILVMFATTCLMFLVITTVWNRSVVWAALFAAGFGSVDLLYLSACLAKVPHGGWLPLLLSLATLLVMSAWHYGTAKKQEYELQNKVCLDHLLGLIGSGSMGLVRGSSFAGAAVVGRSAARSSLAPRRRALVVRAQSEPEMDPTKETSSPSTSSPTPISTPTPTPAVPKPKAKAKANPSVWDALAFSGPAPERINGRLAMVGFVAALSVEAARGGGLLDQAGSGAGLGWFLTTAAVFSVASMVPLLQGQTVESKSSGIWSADAELWNGRFAMLGLVALAATEFITGAPFVNV